MTTQSPLQNPGAFLLAGRAVFTVVNESTGRRFTFKVKANDGDGPSHFVSVLTGSDNTSDYSYLGCLWDGQRFSHGSRSSIGRDALSARAFAWLFPRALQGDLPAPVRLFHEGRCGRCGRALTDPDSISSGFGPICRAA